MSPVAQRVLLTAVILAFGAFTTAVIVEYGLSGFADEVKQNIATLQVLIDLSIVATLVLIWMYRDSRTSEVPFLPYAVVTILAGSFGPLLYLWHRTWKVSPA
jgi:hypothetical protein